jgi:mannose-1-phosphate guanylyltransferase
VGLRSERPADRSDLVKLGVIMSGGSGRRFWPLSRTARPKQLVGLFGGKSLLALAIERLLPIFGPGGIWIVTQAGQADATAEVASAYGPIRVVSEPVGRNTAPCMAYAASLARAALGDATIAFLPADHLIADGAGLANILKSGLDFVESRDLILTLGVRPTRPATGFGYIKCGRRLEEAGALEIFRVARFTEKPTARSAGRYLSSGRYLWNAGIFVTRASTLLGEIAAWLPDMADEFRAVEARAGSAGEMDAVAKCYRDVQDISIDFGVMQRTARAGVTPADIGWDDVGSWASFAQYLAKDAQGNSVEGLHVGIDSHDCVIYAGDKLVATLGARGLVVVVTDDAILLTTKDEAERVKELVGLMEEKGLTYLL